MVKEPLQRCTNVLDSKGATNMTVNVPYVCKKPKDDYEATMITRNNEIMA